MTKGISINFLANVNPLLKGTDDVESAFKKVGSSLDDVSTQGDTAADKLTQKFSQVADQQISDSHRAKQAQLSDNTEVDQGFELSSRERTRLSREALTTVGEQAKQQVGNLATSFDGSLGDLASSAESAAIGLLSFIPGVGLAIGAAAATGLGIVQGWLAKDDAKTKELKTDAAELAKTYIEVGTAGTNALQSIASKLEDLATETDDSKTSLEDIAGAAKNAGLSYQGLADGIAGSNDDLKTIHAQAQQRLDDVKSGETALYGLFGIIDDSQDKQAAAYQKVLDLTGDQIEKNKLAAKEAKLAAEAGYDDYQQKANLLKQVNGALDDTSDATSKYLNVEKGIFNVKDYIKAFDERAKALDDYQRNLLSSGLSTEAKNYLESQGEDTAALLLSGYEKSNKSTQAALDRIWSINGQAAAGTFNGNFEDAMSGKKVKGPAISLEVDVPSFISDTQRKLNSSQLRLNSTIVLKNPTAVPIR